MTHNDFITEVARQLGWTEDKTSKIIDTFLEIVRDELKMNNPVVFDDFAVLNTDIQPEYIRVDREKNERYLIPPTVTVVLETIFPESEEDVLPLVDFVPDENLYNEINGSFSQFEPTLLNEDMQFPGISEIIVGELETDEESAKLQYSQKKESLLSEYIYELIKEEDTKVLESSGQKTLVEGSIIKKKIETTEFPPPKHSPRRLLRNRKTSPIWIPIAGGIVIIMASLFFFKGNKNK